MPRKSKSKQGKVSFGTAQRVRARRSKQMTSAPVSRTTRLGSNSYGMSNCHDPALGQGVRLTASNTICGVKQWNGYSYALALSPYWYIAITPDSLSNGLAALARNFQYYRFTRLVFRYAPACPTTTSRTVRFAYVTDGGYAATESQPTFAGLADFEYCWSTPCWSPASYVINNVPRCYPAYYQAIDTGATAGKRETQQGLLVALFDAAPTADLDVGSLLVDFTIELYGKTTALNITVNNREYQIFRAWQQARLNSETPKPAAAVASAVQEQVPDYEMVSATNIERCSAGASVGSTGPMPGIQQQPLPTPQRASCAITAGVRSAQRA